MLFRSIRSRLLGLVVATVVPFAGLIGFGLWNQWENDNARAIQRASEEARLLAAQVDDHINILDNLLTGVSHALSFDPADTARNDELLRRLKAELPPYIANVMLFALDGSPIGTSSLNIRIDAREHSYFKRAMGGERRAIGEVVRSRGGSVWVLDVARPAFDRDGQMRAVIAVGTKLEHLQDALRIGHLPPGSVVRIANERGIVVAQNLDGVHWIGRDLRPDEKLARTMAADATVQVVEWPDDVQRITGSATAHEVPWVVSVGLPTDIALAGVFWRLIWNTMIAVAAVVVACLIAWTLSGRLVRPMRRLRNDASVLAGGDLSHRTVVATRDEIGDLGEAFNQMAERIEQRQQEKRRAANDLRQTKDTLAAVIDASPVAIVCSDLDRRIFLWNRAAEEMFGYSAEEVLAQNVSIVPPEAEEESRALFERTMAGETLRDVQVKRMREDGSLIDVRVASARMYNPDGTVRGSARAYEDITDRKRAEAQLERIAHYDQLTGLPNRLTLQKELGRLMAGAATRSTAIVLFDLDGFKDVNDTLGHSTGDQLLIEVGQRLKDMAGRRAQVCRLGGDEFVIILPDCGDPLRIGELVNDMLKRLTTPFDINDHVLHIAASAGIAIAPTDGRSVDELIANADLALYQAKREGGRTSRFFLPVLRAQAQARRSLDLELRRAFAQQEFELYFQPQIRLADESVIGAEALIRWRHPERGIVGPGAFIDTLAASPIAPDISRWVIRTACERMGHWRAAGLPLARMAVNLFPTQLADESLRDDIEAVLQDTGLAADALELEITENVAVKLEDAAGLQKLRDMGVTLAFDDFGTGYASLSHLTRFPLARIKIDRSFVAKISDDTRDTAIVRSLIAMAHNLGLEVIAEGVETVAQAEFLRNAQCEEAQGFLYAKPLPAAEFEGYLRTRPLTRHMTDVDPPTLAMNPQAVGRPRRRAPIG
jgi:diguanylate cyclase (GGDEF)-like protein/PAS domain S-box-containing protein